ncbi:MAG: glycosyltransferase [Candidatus Wenzhouxiangella sp. M2_3B_020]
MRIAFLNPQGNFDRADSYLTEHPDFGGQLVYVKELALALAGLGADVDIVTRRIDDPEWPGFDASVDHYDEHADRVRIVRLDAGGPEFLPKERLWPHLGEMVERLVEFYGDAPPEAVTTHYADGGWMGVLLQRATGLPFTFTGHSLGAQKLERLGATPDNIGEIESRFRFSRRIAAERAAMAHAGRIVTSTRAERFEQYAHPLYEGAVETTDDARFAVVPPGINERIFHSGSDGDDPGFLETLKRRAGSDDRPMVLASSRLDAKKNVGGFVEAWLSSAELRERARLALFVRGIDDPFTELDRLREDEQLVLAPILARIDAEGLRDDVVFVNAGSQRQLATAYRFFARRGSVFVLPSLYEPFGLAPIEAAACGLAVVATRHGGPSEVFADGTGILVEPAEPGNMADGMLEALRRHDELSRSARQMVNQRYTWRRTAEGYLDVVQDLKSAAAGAPAELPPLDAGNAIGNWLARHGGGAAG